MTSAEGGALAVGFGLAVLSAVFNGSFTVFGKLCKTAPDPVIFNTFLTYGCLLLSFAVPMLQALAGVENVWYGLTPWGMAAGALFVGATLFSFIAIPLAGLAMSCATWSASAILVAFLWGAVGPTSPPRQPMGSVGFSLFAVLLLLLGTLVINLSSWLGQQLRPRLFSDAEASLTTGSSESCEAAGIEEGCHMPAAASRRRALGLLSAATVGLFGGSVLVPASYAPAGAGGLRILPSFGVGAAITGTVIGAVYWVIWRPPLSKELRPDVVRNGMLAGVVWNLGNACQIVAQNSYHLSYGIAYPILQCGMVFGGIWGIYYFKEESSSSAVAIFWGGVLLVIAGVVLLGLHGPGSA